MTDKPRTSVASHASPAPVGAPGPPDDRGSSRPADRSTTSLGDEATQLVPAGAPQGSASSAAPGSTSASLPRTLGQYEILEEVGRGGMGQVFRVRHQRLQRIFALKILPRGQQTSDAAIARFSQEVLAGGRLDVPHVVRTTDAGEQDGVHYLVMEYIEGAALDRLVQQLGPLPIAEACEIARQAAVGLAQIETHGMVHRDLKPANLMLDHEGHVKILDLGLAKLLRGEQGELTTAGAVMGTIDFMAPEQADDSATVDIRADLYSLGATLYFLLAGRPPLVATGGIIARLKVLASEVPVSLRTLRPDVPLELAQLVEHLLAKDPRCRPDAPGQLAETLARFAQGANLATLRSAEPAGLARTVDYSSNAKATIPRGNSWRRLLVGLASLAALLVLLGAIVVKLQTRDGEIQVEIEQPGATVLVDDKQQLVVTSPERKVYRIAAVPGARKLRVRMPDGTQLLAADVEVQAGRTSKVFRATLTPTTPTPTQGKGGVAANAPVAGGPRASDAVVSGAPREAKLVTVAQDGSADCTTIGQALQVVRPGGMIRILDGGEYHETLVLDSRLRHAGLTIESPAHATIVGTKPGSVVMVTAPRVTLRGLTLRTDAVPAILCTIGVDCAGTTVEDLRLVGTVNAAVQGVSVEHAFSNRSQEPVRVRRCRVESCAVGIKVTGLGDTYDTHTTCRNVTVTENLLVGNPVGIRLLGNVRNVAVAGNRVAGGLVFGVQLEQLRGKPGNLWIAHNTFVGNRFNVRVWDSSVVAAKIHLLNNLSLDAQMFDWAFLDSGGTPDNVRGPGDVAQIHARWRVMGNWREGVRPDADQMFAKAWVPPGQLDRLEKTIEVVSRDPSHVDFARPSADSPLAGAAQSAGLELLPKFVGAVPPVGQAAFDWQALADHLLTLDDPAPSADTP